MIFFRWCKVGRSACWPRVRMTVNIIKYSGCLKYVCIVWSPCRADSGFHRPWPRLLRPAGPWACPRPQWLPSPGPTSWLTSLDCPWPRPLLVIALSPCPFPGCRCRRARCPWSRLLRPSWTLGRARGPSGRPSRGSRALHSHFFKFLFTENDLSAI